MINADLRQLLIGNEWANKFIFWRFAGEMSRDTAEAVLRNTQPGTFLLRSRVRDSLRSSDPGYALSLK